MALIKCQRLKVDNQPVLVIQPESRDEVISLYNIFFAMCNVIYLVTDRAKKVQTLNAEIRRVMLNEVGGLGVDVLRDD